MKNLSDQYMIFILDKKGKVHASMPNRYFNLTLNDTISRHLIEEIGSSKKSGIQLEHSGLVDTLYPIDVDGRIIGYARVILDSNKLDQEINIITNKGILFIFIAIIVGALFAWLSVHKMTQRLRELTKAAHKLAEYKFEVKLPADKGSDEVGTMIEAFEVMQSSIHHYIHKIDANQKRLNLALEGSSDGLWDWNIITNEVYYSPRWKEMIGYSDSELKNCFETWQDNIHPDDIDRVMNFIESFLASTTTNYEQKFRMRTKEGQYIPILARAKKVFDNDGKAIRLIGTHVDMSEISKAQERLRHQAQHDTLTNLPNRLLFIDRLEQAILQAQRYKHKVAVLFLDLDHFKEINDSLGHDIGDKLLQEIANILQQSMRKSDTISRFGGDEFAIIIDKVEDENLVISVLEKTMRNINITHSIEGNEFFATFSIGIALYPNDGLKSETLLKNADAAMYEAKKSGRNNYQFYTNDMTQKALERMQLETALRNALASDELDVHYQPQVNLKSQEIIGMEALVRWRHPERGSIEPKLFIALAEETGLISGIDTFVMKRVIEDMYRWKSQNIETIPVAINISVIELMRGNYFEVFAQMLEKYECIPSQFEFEVTESQIMKDLEYSIKKLHYLNSLGVKLSIDDFGTGYSSLAYLKQLPIHKLKIDKSFIDDIAYDSDDREIVKTIISMAKNMNLSVIAEGVEYRNQVQYLMKHGCDEIQGYYYYKPMPQTEITKILKMRQSSAKES
jgi:diguanylate cyclase (GGDEF)-like protein/PAS domain S-box-containing protein